MSDDTSKIEINLLAWYQSSNPHRDIRFLYVGGTDKDHARFRKLLSLVTIPEGVQLNPIFCRDMPEVMTELYKGWGYVLVLDSKLTADMHVPMSTEEHYQLSQIPHILHHYPHLEILILSESNRIADVVRTANHGATNFLFKDYDDRRLAAILIVAAYRASMALDRFLAHHDRLQEQDGVQFVGKSFALRKLKQRLEDVALPSGPILLLGETGTGKTTAAKYIHELRLQEDPTRKHSRFISINMAAVSAELIESELFGYEPGAFTDAKQRHIGFFEQANGGTLFLDEIGEASLSLQAKILKAVDEKKFNRLGGGEVKSSFKLICATNQNLEKLVAEKKFREDLYMRISTYEISVPSLKERQEDIPEIIKQLLPKACEESGVYVPFDGLPSDFIKHLSENPIEGNIRGIKLRLVRLLTYSPKDRSGRPILKSWRKIVDDISGTKTPIDPHQALTFKSLDRPFDMIGPEFPGLKEAMRVFENKVLTEAKKKFKKNVDIAKALKIDPATVCRRLQSIKA